MATLEPELYEILAQLDFLVQRSDKRSLQDKGYGKYRNEVFDEIAKRMDNRYTASGVRKRLWQTFRYKEKFPEQSFDFIFKHGSSAFKLSGEQREGIKTHLNLVQMRHDLDQLQHEPPGRRRLRSRSLRSKSIATVQAKNLRQRSNPVGLDPFAVSRRSRNRSTGSVVNSRLSTPKNQRRRKGANRAVEIVTSSIEVDETPCQSPASALTAAESSTPVMSVNISAKQEDSNLDDTMLGLCSSDIGVCPEPEPGWAPPIPSESDFAMITDELAYYKKRCEEAEERAKSETEQRRQIKNLGEVPEARKASVCQLIRQINKLQKRLKDRKTLERYLLVGDIQNTVPGSQQVLTEFESLKGKLPSLLVVNGTYVPSVGRLKGCSDDLDDLLIDIFGENLLCRPQELPEIFPPLTAFELVQSLVGAALKSWVFEREFQTYTFATTPLIQEYRKLIATTCGLESLCNVDNAVHTSVIRNRSFKEVIVPGISETLTTRLINALRPVFKIESRRDGPKKLKPSLHSVIRIAVQLRSEMLITSDSYELIWPVVGSLFDRKDMQPRGTGSVVGTHAVRLPLCPGIRVYVKEKAMVEYHGFKTVAANTSTPKHVAKALILR